MWLTNADVYGNSCRTFFKKCWDQGFMLEFMILWVCSGIKESLLFMQTTHLRHEFTGLSIPSSRKQNLYFSIYEALSSLFFLLTVILGRISKLTAVSLYSSAHYFSQLKAPSPVGYISPSQRYFALFCCQSFFQ